jgi:3',5'-cyclic AMP phosphodiesterase CpdA
MSVVMQISDTHFGTEQPHVMHALAVLSRRLRPDLLVLSGDITQRARPLQFKAARAFMDSLGAPMVSVPGNHDISLLNLTARFFRPYAHYSKAFGADLEQVHSSPTLLVICVNTTRAYRHKHGEVSVEQIERAATRLSQASAAQLRVVVVHQPMAAQRAQDAVHLVRGHAVALQRWSSAGADVVMGGHIHLPYVVAVPTMPRPLWVLQAGTAVSKRVRPGVPNSVNVLHWRAGADGDVPSRTLRIEQWDFDAVQQAFACVRVTDIEPCRTPL